MDCLDAREHLLDRSRDRLPAPLRDEVARHLELCAACRRAEAAESALDDLLARRLPRHAAPPALRARLAELLPPQAAAGRRRAAPRRLTRALAPALAAGLLLGAGALLVADRYAVTSGVLAVLAGEAVNDHLRVLASQHPLDIESTGSHEVKPWFEGKLDFAPDIPAPEVIPAPEGTEFRLRGGALGYFQDRKAAVAVYTLRRHVVTLLAFRAAGLGWPRPDLPLGTARGRAASARGFNVVLWRAGDLGYALVSDIPPEDLRTLAAAFAPATLR